MNWGALGAAGKIAAPRLPSKASLALSLWLLSSSSYSTNDISEAVARYFADFNRGVAALELVNAHWHQPSALFTPDGVILFETRQDTARWLKDIQTQIAEDGWIRSDILESAICPLGDTLALYSMKFKRVFSDGSESIAGGTYTLVRSDEWRIASLTVVNPDSLLRCD